MITKPKKDTNNTEKQERKIHMKKLLSVVIMVFLLVSMLCINAFASTVSSDDVIRVYGLKEDDSTVFLNGYKKFEEGWEGAVDYAENHDYMDENGYKRIVVDLLADWVANKDGEFGDSWDDGFRYSTIYVPSDTRITINMNGHKIDRGLKENELDGEVIFINDEADIIINGGKSGDPIVNAKTGENVGAVQTGTITGGNSDNGAGGIRIQDGARVTLNNVNVVGNIADDDWGAGIGLSKGSTFIMNGGSIADNICYTMFDAFGGGIYAENSTVKLDGVAIRNNQGTRRIVYGAAIYAADKCTVSMNNCKVIGNGTKDDSIGAKGSISVIEMLGGELSLTNTDFIGNGYSKTDYSYNVSLINLRSGRPALSIDSCTFTENDTEYMLSIGATDISVTKTQFTDNNANVLNCVNNDGTVFTDCVFNNNNNNDAKESVDYHSFDFEDRTENVRFVRCDMGNSTYSDRSKANFADTDDTSGAGSIFGEGSLAMIVAFVALIASVAAIIVNFTSKKEKSPSGVIDPVENDE